MAINKKNRPRITFRCFIKIISYSSSLALLISCNNSDGTIEKRHKSYYLVNNSFTESYVFTIKKTNIKDRKYYSYENRFLELAPGAETRLGLQQEIYPSYFPVIKKSIIEIYQPKRFTKAEKEEWQRKRKSDPFIIPLEVLETPPAPLFDTVIKGKNRQYYYRIIEIVDSAHPIAEVRYDFSYEVVGQRKIGNKK